MSTDAPGDARPQDHQPTTEEALPNVDLGADDETEERARETLGPEAAERGRRGPGEGASGDEPHMGEGSDEEPLDGER